MRKKIEIVFTRLFSIVLTICILVALVGGACFVAAFFIGGDKATALCLFANEYIMKTVYVTGAMLSLVGVIKMYIAGEKNFHLKRKGKTRDLSYD